MKIKRNKKGIALVFVLLVILILSVSGAALVSRSINEGNLVLRYKETTEAFWLAEAGLNRALDELRSDYTTTGNTLWRTQLGNGGYYLDITAIDAENKQVTAYGYVPFTGDIRAQRSVQAMMTKSIPGGFFNNAIYSGGEVDFNGSSYSVSGDVIYADGIDYSSNEVTGTISQDSSISPLARLDFESLLSISEGQINVYIEQNNRYINEATGEEGFPSSFWYSEPTDPADPATGTPNVVYVKSDLDLNGNVGTIGGFFVVVGDVITNPDAAYDAGINGNGSVEGCIYTRGNFDINGGGSNAINVNGGVWAGVEAELNGNASITYNSTYMSAIEAIIVPEVQVTSWRDAQGPYQVSQ